MALYMLDTDTVSFALRGAGEVGTRLARHKRTELCLSAVTVAELRFGANKRGSRKIHRAIDAFLSGVEVLAFDVAAADRFGIVAAGLAGDGTPIGHLDTMIAAHALAAGATLVTNNQRHFAKVSGLRIENWA
jgi:tRNA(fMet)-specific endonuclease VapC